MQQNKRSSNHACQCWRAHYLVAAVACGFSFWLLASDGAAHADELNEAFNKLTAGEANALEKEREDRQNEREFAGISFGVGIGVTFTSERERIEEAVLVDNAMEDGPQVIRATKKRNTTARILLETHYFFSPWHKNLGFGPFIAIQPGNEEIIEAAGAGVMMGLRRDDRAQSFNMGVGVLVEPSVKTLGDGQTDGEPLPAGESEIRFQEKAIYSLVIIGSFAF